MAAGRFTDGASQKVFSGAGEFRDNDIGEGIEETYHSFEELEQAIRRYIAYYNNRRIKERLGWLSPVEYRLRHTVA